MPIKDNSDSFYPEGIAGYITQVVDAEKVKYIKQTTL